MEQIVVNGFKIDWSRAEATSSVTSNKIEAKQLALLKVLFQAGGQIVSQQTLLDEVWANTLVAPNTVQQTIAQLRKTLGDNGKAQKAIKTHPKLGYSLVFSSDNPADSQSTQIKSLYSKRSFRVLASIVTLVSFLLLFSTIFNDSPAPYLSELKPLTINEEVVVSATKAPSSNSVFYIVENGQQHDLYKRDINKATAKLIAPALSVHGPIHISPDSTTLAFGELVVKQGKKCISLVTLDLNSFDKKQLPSCQGSFSHSPKWISNTELLYLATDKNRNNRLMHLDLTSNQSTAIHAQNNHIKSYDITNNNLLSLSGNTVTVNRLSALLELSPATHTFSADVLNATRQVRWLPSGHYALLAPKAQLVNPETNQVNELNMGLSGTEQIVELLNLSNNKYLAILGSENWDIAEKPFNSEKSTDIGKSVLLERGAKYRGQTNQVSFISYRNNVAQIWLEQESQLSPLTDVRFDVANYIWSHDGNQLIFISGEKLWTQKISAKAKPIDVAIKPIRLYQATKQGLLLSAIVKGKESLVLIDQQNRVNVLVEDKITWAQYIADNWLITTDNYGKLLQYKDGVRSYVDPLSDVKVQWRFFWRQDKNQRFALYFQDKEHNIWRFLTDAQQAEIVGHYNAQTLYVTDISALHSSILSDHYRGAKKDLVQIDIVINE